MNSNYEQWKLVILGYPLEVKENNSSADQWTSTYSFRSGSDLVLSAWQTTPDSLQQKADDGLYRLTTITFTLKTKPESWWLRFDFQCKFSFFPILASTHSNTFPIYQIFISKVHSPLFPRKTNGILIKWYMQMITGGESSLPHAVGCGF